MGRRAVACDVNDVAFCLTRAKTNAPALPTLKRRITQLESRFDARLWYRPAQGLGEFFDICFQRRTLQQLLYLRGTLNWKSNKTDAMIASIALGSLHGEMDRSNSYLSNQMPRTIATKPRYSVKFWKERGLEPPTRDVFELLRNRVAFRYETKPPSGESLVLHRDMRELPWVREELPAAIRCVVTSPPYFDVTNFEEDQWLRLWFLGGPPYPTRGRVSRDDRHSFQDSYWGFIADMWRSLGSVTSARTNVVIRIGSSRLGPERLEKSLTASSAFSRRRVERVSFGVSQIRNRQTEAFRPGSKGCSFEVDCHYRFRD